MRGEIYDCSALVHSLFYRLKGGERNNHSMGVKILHVCKDAKLTAGGRSKT